jgi:acetyl esterase
VSDSENYSAKLTNDGVEVVYREYAGMIHGFFANVAATPSSHLALDFAAEEMAKKTKK